MGRKGKWFVAVKKVFGADSKEKKGAEQKADKSKPANPLAASASGTSNGPPEAPPPTVPLVEVREVEDEQSKHAYSVALAAAAAAEATTAAAAAAEATTAAAQATAQVVQLTSTTTRYSGKSREEAAAIMIQTAFRGYLARRALRALRGLVRLKSLVDGDASKRQVVTTLRCMQTLSRVQSQIQSRRMRMTEENQALQRQLQLKREQELEALRAAMGEEWDDSLQTKEKIDANLMSKHEAAVRRERAMAYAFSHQRKNSKSGYPMFTDLNNPHWEWSWLERWTAGKAWEIPSFTEKELNNDNSVKNTGISVGGEITNAYARRDSNGEKSSVGAQKSTRLAGRQLPSTPPNKAPVARKVKPETQKGGLPPPEDDDSRIMLSLKSEQNRRHSISGPTVRDDESLANSPSTPNFMTPTKSARAKSRFQSPSSNDGLETPERGSVGSVKKRLSMPAADKHSARRHSGPPKVNASSVKDASAVHLDSAPSNTGDL